MTILTRISNILASNEGAVSCRKTLLATCANNGLVATINTAGEAILSVHVRSVPQTKTNFLRGVIFSGKGRILAVPPKSLRRIAANDVANVIGTDPSYSCYEAANGSVCTLYWDGAAGGWKIGSGKLADVSDLALMGGVTFMNVLLELFALKGIALADLSRDLSYSFVVCCPIYHMIPAHELFWIGSWNSVTNKAVYPPEMMPLRQAERRYDAAKIAELSATARQRLIDGSTFDVYGFVLRSTDAQKPDYYVTNEVMTYLHRVIYLTYGASYAVPLEWRKLYLLVQIVISKVGDPALFKPIFDESYRAEIGDVEALFASVVSDYQRYVAGGCLPLSDVLLSEFYALVQRAAADNVAPEALISEAFKDELFEYAKACVE